MRRLTLLATDIVALYGSLAVVLLARYGTSDWPRQWSLHTGPFSVLFIVWLASFYIFNLYEARVLRSDRDFFSRLIQALIIAGMVSVAFFYLIPSIAITPRANLFLFILTVAAFTVGARALANEVLAGGAKKRLLIVGATDEARDLARFVTENPQLGWTVRALVRVGQETLDAGTADARWMLLDERADLSVFIRDHHIDTVVVSPQAYERSELVAELFSALGHRIDFASLARFTELLTGTVPLGAISQSWFLENIAEGTKRPYESAKRLLDILGAALLGIPALALTPLVALAIKSTSPGSLFFRQTRTGRGGAPFQILKFRTMQQDAEKHTGAVWAKEKDSRITRVGTFLRRSRVDELPQLWNILRGDMSLIGPRAERPEFDAQLSAQVPFYRERYLIRPGLSGWAQINFPYGASAQDAMRKLEYDLFYIKNRSLGLDLEILLKTINISLRRAGR